MARTSDPNSATNQWFFNTKSNTVLDTVGGGYTVFGAVLDAESLATITRINNYKIINAAASGPLSSDPNAGNFQEFPVTDSTITANNVTANFFANITRVGQLFDAGATFPSGAQRSVSTPAAAQATQAVVAPPTAAATAFSTAGPKRNPLFDDAD